MKKVEKKNFSKMALPKSGGPKVINVEGCKRKVGGKEQTGTVGSKFEYEVKGSK